MYILYNSHYEKIGSVERCIDDELPFEIPDSWEWIRLGGIGDWGSGATPSRTNPKYYGGNIPWLKTGDLNDGYIEVVPESIKHICHISFRVVHVLKYTIIHVFPRIALYWSERYFETKKNGDAFCVPSRL